VTWAKVDDNFFNHPKAVAAGPMGRLLYLAGLCYCNRFLTDGQIPATVVRLLDPGLKRADAVALHLVAVGLWKPTPSGFEVHDYLQWNARADDVKAKREANRRRIADWREAHANKGDAPDGNAIRNAVRNTRPTPTPTPTPTPPPVTTPVREKTEKAGSSDPRGFLGGGADSRRDVGEDDYFLRLQADIEAQHPDWSPEQVRGEAISQRQRERAAGSPPR
jgi:hypothetical protein